MAPCALVGEAEAQESCPNIPPSPEEEPGDIPNQLKHSKRDLSTAHTPAEEQTDTWGRSLSTPVLVSTAGSGSWV